MRADGLSDFAVSRWPKLKVLAAAPQSLSDDTPRVPFHRFVDNVSVNLELQRGDTSSLSTWEMDESDERIERAEATSKRRRHSDDSDDSREKHKKRKLDACCDTRRRLVRRGRGGGKAAPRL